MVNDKGLRNLSEVLEDYIEEIGYTLDTRAFNTNMTLDDDGGFVTLPEFEVRATAVNHEGMTVSLSIIPSKNAIFIEDELVKTLN
jgi:hypothetical protein